MRAVSCKLGEAYRRRPAATAIDDPVQRLIAMLPRPLRFVGVGGLGFISDLGLFTLLVAHGYGPLPAQFVSLIAATALTWRLNRAFTFDRSGRPQGEEAMRYAIVTATAQGTSYAIFAALILTVFGGIPQVALVIGAVAAAVISYNGHRLFAFAPHPALAPQPVKR